MMENKKVITRSLIILFLSLSIVYSLTYHKKESLFKTSMQEGNEVINKTGITNQNLGLIMQDSINDNLDDNSNLKNVNPSSSVSLGDIQQNGIISSNTQTFDVYENSNSVSLTSADIKTLPGTTEYFGTLDIVNILGENPKYTLQDSKGNYFAYYGDRLEFIDTVETLGGNVYEMVTESEILQNQLFGDRVSYINLSMFKDIWVIMVVKIDGNVWLLQIPADKYHYSKDYLKSLFIH